MSLLPQSRENRQRLIVYGGLAIVLAAVGAGMWWAKQPARFGLAMDWIEHDWEAEPAVELLREYVRVDTSPATGSEQAGAAWLADKLRAAGIEPQVENLGERNANLWAILEGESREALVLHHHIDVSDIENPDVWVHPPFEAVYDPPWLFGRGVFDMKSIAVAQLMAFLELAASGERPRRSVILLATGDEETGSRLGTEWVLRRHPELVSRFWAVLTEGGVVEALTPEDVKFWGIEAAQKRFAHGVFCAASRERLERLREDLVAYSLYPPWPLVLPPEADRVLRTYAPTRYQPYMREIMGQPERSLTDLAAYRRLPEYVQSMFRAEVFPRQVEEAPDGGFRLPFIVHLPPRIELEPVVARLLPAWMTAGVSMELELARGADSGSPIDHPVFRGVEEAVRRHYSDAPIGLWLLPWSATDARFFRQAGVPAYGFSPFLILTSDTYNVDGPNERMAMPGYVSGVNLYVDAVRRLAAD